MSNQLPGLRDPHPARWNRSAPVQGGGSQPAGSPGASSTLHRHLASVYRLKHVVLAVVILGTALGVMLARYSEPVYSAQSTIWIEVGQGQSDPARSNQLLTAHAWVDLLRSYYVLDHAVMDQGLFLEPVAAADSAVFAGFRLREQFRPGAYRLQVDGQGRVYTLATREGITVEQGEVGGAVGSPVGFDWTPARSELQPGRRVDFAVHHPRTVSHEVGRRLATRMANDGNFLRLEYTDSDPVRVASTLNAIADRYVTVAAELKKTKLDELTDILEEQLRTAESNMREAEMALEGFRVTTITLPSDRGAAITPGLESTRDPVFSGFFQIRMGLEEVRRDREAILSALAEPDATQILSSLEVIPSARESAQLRGALSELAEKEAELRALRNRYADDFVLVRRLNDEINELRSSSIPRIAGGLAQELDRRAASMNSQVESASSELRQIPPRAIEEARLERNVTLASTLYTSLRQRYETARLATASSIPDVRILDTAPVPQKPQKDNRYTFILLGFLGSLGVAVGGVVLLDRVDSSIRFPDEVSRGMGLNVLAMVPRLTDRKGESSEEQLSIAVEVFNELKFSLTHAQTRAGPLVLTITSPSSGDGKSFVSSNLALIAAEMGSRTLLIDGDLRRGRLHKLLRASGTPGLTDYLSERATLDQVIQPTSHPSLSLISCGTRLRNCAQLIRTPRLRAMLEEVKSRYDVVLVDTSPFGPGVDPFVFGTLTENLLVVLRAGATDRALTESKLEVVDRLPIRVLGAVLNDVPMTGAYRYYYAPYFAAYEVVEDAEVAPATVSAGAGESESSVWLPKA